MYVARQDGEYLWIDLRGCFVHVANMPPGVWGGAFQTQALLLVLLRLPGQFADDSPDEEVEPHEVQTYQNGAAHEPEQDGGERDWLGRYAIPAELLECGPISRRELILGQGHVVDSPQVLHHQSSHVSTLHHANRAEGQDPDHGVGNGEARRLEPQLGEEAIKSLGDVGDLVDEVMR
jgi:hypothetical protein